MRNDARPLGEHAPESPVGGDYSPMQSENRDSRDSFKRGRDSHIVNQPAEERQKPRGDDSVWPTSDAAVNTKI